MDDANFERLCFLLEKRVLQLARKRTLCAPLEEPARGYVLDPRQYSPIPFRGMTIMEEDALRQTVEQTNDGLLSRLYTARNNEAGNRQHAKWMAGTYASMGNFIQISATLGSPY